MTSATLELPVRWTSEQTAQTSLRSAGLKRPLQVPWLTIFIVLGLALRCYYYALNLAVWHDEAAQIYNVLHKDYGEMLGPLYYSEACPPLFLAAEKAVVRLLGDSTFSLRLLPFLASCVSLIVLVLLARRILPRQAVLWFALLLACSDRLLNHACEAKPYAVDVLTAAIVMMIGFSFRDETAGPRQGRRLLLLALLSPVLIFLSFPACFLLGGLALGLLPAAWHSRSRATWAAFVLFGAAVCMSFAVLYFTAIHAQKNDRMVSCWSDKFPPWDRPWLVPWMSFVRWTEMVRYAAEPVGNALSALAIIGGVWLWRRGERRLLGMLTWPMALNLVAWLLCCYPLEASRVVVYLAPAMLLLIAAGMPPALAWLRQWGRVPQIAVITLALVPVGLTVLVLFKPWGRLDSATPAAFVLQHRSADEPVVGVLWEQAYYFRELGLFYRTLTQEPTEPKFLPATSGNVRSLWLLTSNRSQEQMAHIGLLEPSGEWEIVERYLFRNVAVLRLRRD